MVRRGVFWGRRFGPWGVAAAAAMTVASSASAQFRDAGIPNRTTDAGFEFDPSRAVEVEDGIRINGWFDAHGGIDRTEGRSENPEQIAHVLRIDLQSRGLKFLSTSSNEDFDGETTSQTTADFLNRQNLQAAINANPYDPCCSFGMEREGKNLEGLAISRGVLVSDVAESASAPGGVSLLISSDNQARIENAEEISDVSNVWTAVSGGPLLLKEGEIKVEEGGGREARSAVGLSSDQRYLFMMVIERSNDSDGASDYETARWLQRFGASEGLALDSGDSSTLVMEHEHGGSDVLNSLTSQERSHGNNLGVFEGSETASAFDPFQNPASSTFPTTTTSRGGTTSGCSISGPWTAGGASALVIALVPLVAFMRRRFAARRPLD